jgi:hypothetical protein
MLTRLRFTNFKAWEDSGAIRLAPVTVLFGANSAGETSLPQLLLLLRQTAESPDRQRVRVSFYGALKIATRSCYLRCIAHRVRAAVWQQQMMRNRGVALSTTVRFLWHRTKTAGPRWTPQNRPSIDGQNRPPQTGDRDNGFYFVTPSGRKSAAVFVRQLRGPHLSSMGVMEQPVEERRDRGGVAEQLATVVDGAIRRQNDRKH